MSPGESPIVINTKSQLPKGIMTQIYNLHVFEVKSSNGDETCRD